MRSLIQEVAQPDRKSYLLGQTFAVMCLHLTCCCVSVLHDGRHLHKVKPAWVPGNASHLPDMATALCLMSEG